MFKHTFTILVAVVAVQGIISWIFPVPYGMESFLAVSVIACLAGLLSGAALGSWGFFSRRPWGLFAGLAVVVLVMLGALYVVIELYRLYHLGGVPENYDALVTWHYALACFLLFFLFGFLRLELSWFGIRIKRSR